MQHQLMVLLLSQVVQVLLCMMNYFRINVWIRWVEKPDIKARSFLHKHTLLTLHEGI